jgi:predicted O-methyltransferase YrrM
MSCNETIEYKKGGSDLIEIVTVSRPDLPKNRVPPYINRARETLYNLVRYIKPKKTVELGVREGHSTTAIIKALVENGRGTLDSFDPVWSEDLFIRGNLEDNLSWFYHEMTGEEGYVWKKHSLDAVDLLYIDTDPHTYDQTKVWFNEYWIHNVRPGGYIALDDCSPYFQEGVDISTVPDSVNHYKLMNKGLWGVTRAIVEFVEEQDDKIEFAFSVWNHSSPGTAIIKLKEGERV